MNNEWESEPDFLSEKDEETGYQYFIARMPITGHLSGYVEVPEHHSFYGIHYDNIPSGTFHGGITLSEFIYISTQTRFPIADFLQPYMKENNKNKVYLLGFDCNHGGDIAPEMYKRGDPFERGTYKNISFVRNECKNLCKFMKYEEWRADMVLNSKKEDKEIEIKQIHKSFKEARKELIISGKSYYIDEANTIRIPKTVEEAREIFDKKYEGETYVEEDHDMLSITCKCGRVYSSYAYPNPYKCENCETSYFIDFRYPVIEIERDKG